MAWYLNYKERIGFKIDSVLGYNIQVVCKLMSPVDPIRFTNTLAALQYAYPLLQLYVTNRLGIPLFHSVNLPIEAVYHHLEEESQVHAWEREDLRIRFTQRKKPMIHVRVFSGDEVSFVIITVSHLVSDGYSVASLYRDIFNHYLHGKALNPQNVIPSLYPFFEKATVLDRIRLTFFEGKGIKYQQHLQKNPGYLEKYETRCRRITLSIAIVNELKRVETVSRVSFHTIFSAICIQAMRSVLPADNRDEIMLINAVNLRKCIKGIAVSNDNPGFFSGTLSHSFPSRSELPLLEQAKEIHRNLFRALKERQQIKNEHINKTLMIWPFFSGRFLVNFIQHFKPCVMTSVISTDTEIDGLLCLRNTSTEALHLFYPYAFSGILVLNRENVFIDINYGWPSTSDELAERYINAIHLLISELTAARRKL